VITASADATARIWDGASGELRLTLDGHRNHVNRARFDSGGERLVTASADRSARIWDAATGELLAELPGHGDYVHDAAFSPDGSRVATAAGDGTVRVWVAQTGTLLARLEGHTGTVYQVAWNPAGNGLGTASADGTGRLWNAPPLGQALVEQAKAGLPGCIPAEQRERLYTPPEPLPWCYEREKWPYDLVTQLTQARNLVASGAYPTAERIYTRMASLHPPLRERVESEAANAYAEHGKSLLLRREDEQAELAHARALERSPSLAGEVQALREKVLINRCQVFIPGGQNVNPLDDYERTIEVFDEAIANKKVNEQMFTCRAEAYERLGQPDRARSDYETALELLPPGSNERRALIERRLSALPAAAET
jgi:hypothetical protein